MTLDLNCSTDLICLHGSLEASSCKLWAGLRAGRAGREGRRSHRGEHADGLGGTLDARGSKPFFSRGLKSPGAERRARAE